MLKALRFLTRTAGGYNCTLKVAVAHTRGLRKNQKKIYFTHRNRKQYPLGYLCFNNVLASKHYRLRDSRLAKCMDCDCKRFYLTFFA